MHDASAATGEAAYRLPRTVLPRRYDLRIEPDLGAATFRGTEDVAVEVVEAVDRILLNAADLLVELGWFVGP
jgi:puromycin-sensitive aminopeptidase